MVIEARTRQKEGLAYLESRFLLTGRFLDLDPDEAVLTCEAIHNRAHLFDMWERTREFVKLTIVRVDVQEVTAVMTLLNQSYFTLTACKRNLSPNSNLVILYCFLNNFNLLVCQAIEIVDNSVD